MRRSISDYHPLLAVAVSALERGNAEAREEMYERRRTALRAEFDRLDSPSELEFQAERLKLKLAIHDFEYSTGPLLLRSPKFAILGDRRPAVGAHVAERSRPVVALRKDDPYQLWDALLKLCDQRNPTHHQDGTEHAPAVEWVNVHTEPAKSVDHE
jgi:hypothetical protein